MFFSFALTSAGHRNQPYSYNINTLFLYLFQVHSPLEVTVLSVDKVCPGDDSVEHSLSREQRKYFGVSGPKSSLKINQIYIQIHIYKQASKPGLRQALRTQVVNTILLKKKKKKVQQFDIFHSREVVLSKHFHTILKEPIFTLLFQRGYGNGMLEGRLINTLSQSCTCKKKSNFKYTYKSNI